jgi:hypothetical protein
MQSTEKLQKAARRILESYAETRFDPEQSTDNAVMLAVNYLKESGMENIEDTEKRLFTLELQLELVVRCIEEVILPKLAIVMQPVDPNGMKDVVPLRTQIKQAESESPVKHDPGILLQDWMRVSNWVLSETGQLEKSPVDLSQYYLSIDYLEKLAGKMSLLFRQWLINR